MVEAVIGEMVPIFFILMIVAVVIGPIWIKNYYAAQDRARLHETLRVAYEKGQPVPPELIESLQAKVSSQVISTPERDLRRALVLICVGLGLCGLGYGFWYGITPESEEGGYIVGSIVAGAGAIPGLIGLAYLMLWFTKRNAPKA